MYHPVRRIAAFLGAGAVLGVPTWLYIGPFHYDASTMWELVAVGLLAAVMLAFAVFATKSSDVPQSALNITRVVAGLAAVTLVAIIVVTAPAMST